MVEEKNFQEKYEENLAKVKAKVNNFALHETLQLKGIGNRRIDEVCRKITAITGKKIFENYNFRTGTLFGIMRAIALYPTKRQELFSITGLTKDHVDLYFKYCGNLPYVNKENNTINMGRPMDVQNTRDFIVLLGAHFDVVIEDSDIEDITQERWDRLYAEALLTCQKTQAHNEANSEVTEGTIQPEYEE